MIAPIYRFYLQIEDDPRVECHPIYKSDVTLDYQLESGKRFFRRQLNGKLIFVRDDYALIMSATYEQTITLYMEISTDMGITWSEYWEGTFSKTDLTINYADQKVSLRPIVADAYKAVINGLEKEFNLIELKPQTDRILVTKRPLVQMYVPNDSVVSCFLSGSHWEEDADETDSAYLLTNSYHFALNTILKEIEITSDGGLDDAVGTYTGRMIITDEQQQLYAGRLYEKNGNYYIDVDAYSGTIPHGGGTIRWTTVICQLCRMDGTPLYVYQTSGEFDALEFQMNPASGSGMSGKMNADMYTYNIYARVLCDVDILRTATFPIPADDIVDNNRNYKRCIPYISPSAYLSNNYSLDPTEYGKRDDGTYFDKPTDSVLGEFYPIAQSTWRYASLWYAESVTYINTEEYGRKEYYLRDAYEISSCINVLLQKIAPTITHENTAEYSEFLYGTPNPVSGDKWYLYLTQKTNILKGEYSEPASKAVTTLQTILKMLESVFSCYWFIDGNKLRIEHISWFQNGGSYVSDTRQVGYDLTQLINIKNGKPWSFGQGEVTFEKQDLPERYQYSWMDDTTEAFDGRPIEVNSPNTEEGRVEDISISNFTSDVDYMLLNPADCSNDGFALLAATETSAVRYFTNNYTAIYGQDDNKSLPLIPIKTALQGIPNDIVCNLTITGSGNCYATWFDSDGNEIQGASTAPISVGTTSFTITGIPLNAYYFGFIITDGTSLTFNIQSLIVSGGLGLPFVSVRIGSQWFVNQNGYLAMMDLQPKYLTYDMPSRNITINGTQTIAKGMSRKARQTVTFPADAITLDTNVLIKTLVGFGEINTLSLNLSSRMIKATLSYENDV